MNIQHVNRNKPRQSKSKRSVTNQIPRIAVIGCGYWRQNLVRNIGVFEQCELVAICDRDTTRLATYSRIWPNVKTVTDMEAICRDPNIDAVVICTPVNTH